MAGYDPKRPRPTVDGDGPVPVDALLEPEPLPSVQPVDPAPVEAAPAEVAPVDPAPVEAAPFDSEPAVAPGVEDRPNRPVQGGASDVPVADAPTGSTANRAVLMVGGAAALAAVAIVLLLRRRRHR